jgi:membrane protease YdiL (CAAX protease family)
MLPSNRTEIALWIVMAITAGICEETVFRGYLQQQISAWSGHVVVGVVGQAVVFGVAHAYQGWKKVALIFVWGCAFGALAWLRKGLRANMIAHAVLDIVSIF